jgi:hypothetical protein
LKRDELYKKPEISASQDLNQAGDTAQLASHIYDRYLSILLAVLKKNDLVTGVRLTFGKGTL